MSEEGGGFKNFLTLFLILGLINLFWNNFKADIARRDGVRSVAKQKAQVVQQKVYRDAYVNNIGLSAVYVSEK